MQKIIFILLCSFIVSGIAHANIIKIGPRVGVHLSYVKVNSVQSNATLANLQLENPLGYGYHVGLFTRLDLLALYIQPELLFTSTSGKSFDLKSTRLNMPVMLGISLLGIFRAQFGPVLGVFLSVKEEDKEIRKRYSSPTIGWQAGLGLDIWRVSVDLKYEISLRRWRDKISGISTHRDYAPWMLSIGFNLL